jgi:hypothetical protein
MLYALRQPATLCGLIVGFAVGCLLRVAGERLVARGPRGMFKTRYGEPRLLDPRAWLDPFGTVAALLTGLGWSPRPESWPGRRAQVWGFVVVAILVHGLLAVGGFAAYFAAGGSKVLLQLTPMLSVLHGTQPFATSFGQRAALGFGMENLGCGLLSLVPIPPLELGVALWSQLPRSAGTRRFAYHLLEEQWGTGALLVLLLLGLTGLLSSIGDRIIGAF